VESGPAVAILKKSFIVPLIWYGFKGNKVFKNPLFLLVFFISIISGFLLSGSRSSILQASIPYFIVYMFKTNKIPFFKLALLGIVFFILFGILGELRRSAWHHEVDWEILTSTTLEESIELASEEVNFWSTLNPNIAITNKVPREVDFLYGKPYLGVILFFIPRYLWPDKPHSTGQYVGSIFFNKSEGGVPPGEFADIFWNFGLLGVLILFFFKGQLLRLFINTFLINSKGSFRNALIIIYTLLVVNFNISTLNLVNSMHIATLLIIIFMIFNILNYRKVNISHRAA